MYLFIFSDGTSFVSTDNLLVSDILAVKSGLLSIFRWAKHFERLTVADKLLWVRVSPGKVTVCPQGRVNLP